MDWDLSAPIPALDGAIQKNLSGSELVIDKGWPVSWVEKWKWWLEQDNYRSGPGSLNKFDVDCIMGVSMISPLPAWTECPLNMVNYYGLGRLAWNPDRSVDEIYTEWIEQTFGDDQEVVDTVKTILLIADDVTRRLYIYRGYRGVWIDRGDDRTVENRTPHVVNRKGIGPATPELRMRMLTQYAPGLRDVYGNMDEAVALSEQMVELWKRLEGEIDARGFQFTIEALVDFVDDAQGDRDKMAASFEVHTGRRRENVVSRSTPARLASVGTFNVRHYGAVGDGTTNDAPAINKAIETCNAGAGGGGTVLVPSGIYATGSIHLKSNVTLALDAGAVLKAMPDIMDPWEPNPHDKGLMDSAYYHWEASLIWGKNIEHVKIYGQGTLDGSSLTRSSNVPKGTGDKSIALKLCKNVEIRNLNIREGGHYALLATGCEDMLIDNVTIKTSRDGLNLSQCKDVQVIHCHIDAVRYEDGYPAGGDDAIKLGSDLSLGNVRPSENITVRDCFLPSGCNALQFGTETIGPLENIRFENIRITAKGGLPASQASLDPAENEERVPRLVGAVPAYGLYVRHARNIRFFLVAASDSKRTTIGPLWLSMMGRM